MLLVVLPGISVTDVMARIDAAAQRADDGAIAFDGDGTLWSGDVGEDWFAAVLASGRVTESARLALAREAAEHGVDAGTGDGATHIAHAIHAAYLAGTFPEERVCEVMTWVTAGWTTAEQASFAAEVVRDVGVASRLHAEAIAVVRWAGERGLPVHLVSASPRAIVLEAAKVAGIDASRVVAAREAVSGDRVEPSVVRPIPYGPGKVTRLREQLGERPLHAAFGDNAFDAAMLRAATIPVAIRPKARLVDLVERAPAEVPGLVVLERL